MMAVSRFHHTRHTRLVQRRPRRSFYPYSTDQKWTAALLKLLVNINASDYAFHVFLTWTRAAIPDGFSFQPEGGKTCRRIVELLFALMNNATQLLPPVRTVAVVPHVPSCDVITFDFVPQLLKLFKNRTIMTKDNLLIDVHNPLILYTSPDGVQGETLSGQVYQYAYCCLATDPQRQLFPHLDNGLYVCHREWLIFLKTLHVYPSHICQNILTHHLSMMISWLSAKTKNSSAQNQTFNLGDNIQNNHAQLQIVLSSFWASSLRLQNVQLPLGTTGSMNVDTVTAFFLQYKTCKKVMHFVVVTAPTCHLFNAYVDRAMPVTYC